MSVGLDTLFSGKAHRLRRTLNGKGAGFPLERKLVLVLPFSSVPSSLLTSNSDVFESALNIASTPEKIE